MEVRAMSSPRELEAALHALGHPHRVPLSEWPGDLTGLDLPGLYAYWVNAAGAADLACGLEAQVSAGRVYVGQAGGTQWPSGKRSRTTLRSRIGRNHLGGNIRGSTFRHTLAATLRVVLGIQADAERLLGDGEALLTEWIKEHLEVAVFPFEDRDALNDLEINVLRRLDPPLNLNHVIRTDVRRRLSAIRRMLRRSLKGQE
ncbi:MAG TPA: hypothetical protein VJK02_17300 [Anaerolineales bacterium]|nr:hypothetical protein [Anaerolineales bacterium]